MKAKIRNKWATPKQVSEAAMVFGGIDGLMPSTSEMPEQIEQRWLDWQREWFYHGLSYYPRPKDGIDLEAAMRHLSTIQGSFRPKHEHKEAAVAYLASLWFADPTGEPTAGVRSA